MEGINKNTGFDEDIFNRYQESVGNDVTKVSWFPDEAAVQETLVQIRAVMQLPKIYFTSESISNEFKGIEFEFRDDLIQKYEVTSKDGMTRITIYPVEESEPIFSIRITDEGIKGDSELLSIYTVMKRTLDTNTIVAYNGPEIDIQSNNATGTILPTSRIFRETDRDSSSNGELS